MLVIEGIKGIGPRGLNPQEVSKYVYQYNTPHTKGKTCY